MRFLILGSLEVHDEHGVLRLGGIKPRAVLAMLLLHANEPVSAERLALALWGEDAPDGASKTVHVHVWRLRKALGDAGLIATTPAGYCLRVDPDEFDAASFERLLEDDRQALADAAVTQPRRRPGQGCRPARSGAHRSRAARTEGTRRKARPLQLAYAAGSSPGLARTA
jgi:DNA-binding SARP family transcriptional activator